MTRCQRCGQETTTERCEVCKKEQGVIGQSRLTDVIKVLEKEFKDRTHGFTIGEANNALPYNFTFTKDVLEKLRNLNILESRVINGTKKYIFTGRKLESMDRLGLISDYHKNKETKPEKKVHSDFLPRTSCKYCGNGVLYHQIVCSACRPQWLKDLFEMIKPVFDDNKKHPIPEIYPKMKDIKKSSSYGLIDEMVKKGWLECEKIGRLKYYSMPDQTPTKKEYVKPEIKPIPKPKNITPEIQDSSQTEPTIINVLINILPGLLNSKIFSIEPETKQVQAKFTAQKPLLDLYETLPEPLKNSAELTIDPTNQTQKITIPLETGK